MDGELRQQSRAVLASARALLEEFSEEGIAQIEAPAEVAGSEQAAGESERPPVAEERAPAIELQPDPSPTPPATSTPSPQDLGLERTWGASPSLEDVREALGECTRCPLCEKRNKIVFGHGDPDADLMFIGEGPGENEDQQGLPFVGRAGELLTQMIEKGLGISRSSTYICNIVKCRPPGNRNPMANEISACQPFLDGQIDAVKPKVIVSLGKPATSLLLGHDVAITRIRGDWHDYRGTPLMPTFHPAYVLRQYTEAVRRNVWSDLRAALERSRQTPEG